jgi:hypothetical protein
MYRVKGLGLKGEGRGEGGRVEEKSTHRWYKL